MTVLELKELISNLEDDREIRILSDDGKEYDFTGKIRHTVYSTDFLYVEEF